MRVCVYVKPTRASSRGTLLKAIAIGVVGGSPRNYGTGSRKEKKVAKPLGNGNRAKEQRKAVQRTRNPRIKRTTYARDLQ